MSTTVSHDVSLERRLLFFFPLPGPVSHYTFLSCLIKSVPFFKEKINKKLLFCAIMGGDGAVPYRYHKKGDGEREEGSTENRRCR